MSSRFKPGSPNGNDDDFFFFLKVLLLRDEK